MTEGFEKTSSTFTDVIRRLTIIDEAQKKITELSSHVVSLQDVLVDKRARSAFGNINCNLALCRDKIQFELDKMHRCCAWLGSSRKTVAC